MLIKDLQFAGNIADLRTVLRRLTTPTENEIIRVARLRFKSRVARSAWEETYSRLTKEQEETELYSLAPSLLFRRECLHLTTIFILLFLSYF